jgi:glutamate racemase
MGIGVFDSGLGGLTILRALLESSPNQAFVYLGDNANAPYGERSPDEVYALTRHAVETLFDAGCPLVLLACNTASALALRRLQQDWLPNVAPDRRVLGVFVPMIEAITGRRWAETGAPSPAPGLLSGAVRRVAFFATPATVASGAFEREAARRVTGIEIDSIACPGLVDALEAGDREAAEALARQAARRLSAAPDIAVLGCTHYPLVASAFRAGLPEATEILNQPLITAASLARYLERCPALEAASGGGGARLRCLTTGDAARVSARASAFFGRPLRFAAV